MNIYKDIETVPNQTGVALAQAIEECASLKAAVKAPSNYKDQAKIDAYIADACAEIDQGVHEKVAKTSFDGALGHIAVIGAAFNDEPPIAFYVDSTEPHRHEGKIITEYFDWLKAKHQPTRDTRPVFVGHNIVGFDLLFMFQRCVVLGIEPPAFIPFMAKPWDDVVYDTMVRWAGPKGTIKLDKLARALGLPGKTGMDGSQVWPAIAAGRIKDVADYCINTDVAQVRDIHKRMTFSASASAAA